LPGRLRRSGGGGPCRKARHLAGLRRPHDRLRPPGLRALVGRLADRAVRLRAPEERDRTTPECCGGRDRGARPAGAFAIALGSMPPRRFGPFRPLALAGSVLVLAATLTGCTHPPV